QRLQLLSDALGEQYAQHGNWRFLRNNDRFVFQILRSFEHDNSEDKPGPGMPPHGWRTQFWVVDQNNKVLVGPRAPIPPDGTRRPILVNGDRKSTRLNSSHVSISYAVFCLKKKNK